MRVRECTGVRDGVKPHFHLASVEMFWWVSDESTSPVALNTSDDVVAATLDTLRDDTEAVALHDAGAADTTEETLLDTLAEPNDSNTGRRLHDNEGQLVEKWG